MADGVARIIFLHGASSSGKSSLARALQGRLDAPFLHYSIDHLRDSGMLPLQRVKAGDFAWKDMRAAFFEGFHRSIAAFAAGGNDLIIEHILDTAGWQEQLAGLLAPFDLFFVAVHCSLPELIRREAARGDRPMGSAAEDFRTIHNDRFYDFEADGEAPAGDAVERVLAAWSARRGRSAFFSPRAAA